MEFTKYKSYSNRGYAHDRYTSPLIRMINKRNYFNRDLRDPRSQESRAHFRDR